MPQDQPRRRNMAEAAICQAVLDDTHFNGPNTISSDGKEVAVYIPLPKETSTENKPMTNKVTKGGDDRRRFTEAPQEATTSEDPPSFEIKFRELMALLNKLKEEFPKRAKKIDKLILLTDELLNDLGRVSERDDTVIGFRWCKPLQESPERSAKEFKTTMSFVGFSLCSYIFNIVAVFWTFSWIKLALYVLSTAILNAFSILWHIYDGTATFHLCTDHVLGLGFFHRHVEALRRAFVEGDSKTLHQLNYDLSLLNIFRNFHWTAPLLVLHLYDTIPRGESLRNFTHISFTDYIVQQWTVICGLCSLELVIVLYTYSIHCNQPDKEPLSKVALVLLSCWRLFTITARIHFVALLALASLPWLIGSLGVHWALMTWVARQRTDFCKSRWERWGYNAVAGLVHCFSFINLRQGPSWYKAILFYFVLTLQDLLCVYVLWGDPSYRDVNLIIIFSTVIGLVLMGLYYAFFHPTEAKEDRETSVHRFGHTKNLMTTV